MLRLLLMHPLEAPLAPLVRDFLELKSRGAPFVLATIIGTEGSTYRKAGTHMLITKQAELRGLLSGGCLEVDLVEHAREVLATGQPRVAAYDMRGYDDRLFGIGSGCEGAMSVLLQRVGRAEAWQPLEAMALHLRERNRDAIALIAAGDAAGRGWWTGGRSAPWKEPAAVQAARRACAAATRPAQLASEIDGRRIDVLVIPLCPAPVLLVCGAGVDAVPLVRLTVALGFDVTVCDHRPALLLAERFPACTRRCQPLAEFARIPELAHCEAAVVMSHQLAADLAYLRAIADRPGIGYVGLLGPPPRRSRLLGELDNRGIAIEGRLRAPVGIDIGARTPEAIALAVAAELHAWFARRSVQS